MAGWHWCDDDDYLLRLVAAATGEPPPFVVEVGLAAYTWRSVNAELEAILTAGSSRDDDPSMPGHGDRPR